MVIAEDWPRLIKNFSAVTASSPVWCKEFPKLLTLEVVPSILFGVWMGDDWEGFWESLL